MAPRNHTAGGLLRLPLFLLIWGVACLAMWVPATHAVILNDHPTSQSFFFSGLLGLFVIAVIALSLGNKVPRYGMPGQLLSLLGNATVRSIFMRSMDRSIRSLGQFLLARRKPGGGDVEEAGKGTLRERFSSALRKLRVRREDHVDPLHVRAASAVASIVNRAAGMVQGRTSHRARL